MVTEAGKELLRNTINTAKFHNRILEENEMWKQWELERGLTMMVSDDVILSKTKSYHKCSRHRKRSRYDRDDDDLERSRKMKGFSNSPCSSKDTLDRWDHNGFRELYPDEDESRSSNSSSKRSYEKKWDHSGFLELYPEEAHKDTGTCSKTLEHPKKSKRKKKKRDSTSDDNEIWEEFKRFKRSSKGGRSSESKRRRQK